MKRPHKSMVHPVPDSRFDPAMWAWMCGSRNYLRDVAGALLAYQGRLFKIIEARRRQFHLRPGRRADYSVVWACRYLSDEELDGVPHLGMLTFHQKLARIFCVSGGGSHHPVQAGIPKAAPPLSRQPPPASPVASCVPICRGVMLAGHHLPPLRGLMDSTFSTGRSASNLSWPIYW